MTSHVRPETLDQVAEALAEIAVIAETELSWSDHGCDTAMSRILSDAAGALRRLGYEVPEAGRPLVAQ